MERERHVSVLLEDAIRYLNVRRGGTYIDATLGLAGHSTAIARLLGPEGTLIAFDRDPQAMSLARERLERLRQELGPEMPTLELHDTEFGDMARRIPAASADGILADFGVSSLQFDEAARGFSFQTEGPLDMRMNPRQGRTAEQVVNQSGEKELA